MRGLSGKVGIVAGGGRGIGAATAKRLASEGVITGAIQIPVDGMPLIFGPDHPTTGGYPVIAVVSRHSRNLLAQSEPGTKVRFRKAR